MSVYNINGETIDSGGGLSENAKQVLLACFERVAWIDRNSQNYYDALESVLYSGTDVVIPDEPEEEYKYTWNYPNDITLHSVMGFSSDNSDIYSANDHRSLYVDNGKANTQLLYTNGNLINNGSAFMIPIPSDATKATVTISQSWMVAFSVWNYSNGRNSRTWVVDANGWNTGTKTITFTAQENLALGLSYKLQSGADITAQDVGAISIVFG